MPRISIPKIFAPKPADIITSQSEIEFRLSEDTATVLHQRRLSTRKLEFIALIAGMQPDFNNITQLSNPTSLADVKFIFKGLNRPTGDKLNGDDTNVYVLQPQQTYEYQPNLVCPAMQRDAPEECCLAIFVKFDYTIASEPIGEILDWRWTECDLDGRPLNWETRYMEEVKTDV